MPQIVLARACVQAEGGEPWATQKAAVDEDVPIPYTFMAYDMASIAYQPYGNALEFPAFLTHCSGVDFSVLDLMVPLFDKGVRPESLSDTMLELGSKKYTKCRLLRTTLPATLMAWPMTIGGTGARGRASARQGSRPPAAVLHLRLPLRCPPPRRLRCRHRHRHRRRRRRRRRLPRPRPRRLPRRRLVTRGARLMRAPRPRPSGRSLKRGRSFRQRRWAS